MVTDRERFLFDLNGYLVLENAIDSGHVKACNEVLDEIIRLEPPLKHGEWYGGVHAHTFGGADGVNLQQIYEAGEPFERLLDHPSWWDHVREFVGGQSNFDASHGPLFIDENFASLRGPGEALGIHSGGHEAAKRNQFRYHLGEFMCGQVNILLALTDIGPGDGGTMLIPGSHKANFAHPQFEENVIQHGKTTSLDDVEGAIEVHMEAGDALLFVDTICHGSAKRVNEDLRRICVFRYGPSWGFFRGPYRPTRELLERLTEQRRQIVWPHEPVLREPNRKPGFENPPKILPE